MITFVWAEDEKRKIGLNGHLPWRLPADMKHFKELTMGHPIVMGHKTFTSLPHILPGRPHIVLSADPKLMQQYRANQQVKVVDSLATLFDWLRVHQDEKICVIGGVSVFTALADQVDCLERTLINETFTGDILMPLLDYSKFKLIKHEHFEPNKNNKYAYDFLTYLRKGNVNDA